MKVFAAVSATSFILFIFFRGYVIFNAIVNPPKPPPPEEKFGKLPLLEFNTVDSRITYRINTIDGTLPLFSDRMRAYKIVQPEANILALPNVREQMRSIGYTAGEIRLANSDTHYQWTNTEIGGTLIYDLLTNNFSIRSTYLSNPDFADYPLPAKDQAIDSVKAILESIGVDVTDVNTEKSTVDYFKILNSQLVSVPAADLGKVMKVNIVQNNIPVSDSKLEDAELLPIVYEKPDEANINFTAVRKKDGTMVLIDGHYIHFVVNLDEHTTYPIKSTEEAFEDLKNGNAAVFYKGNLQIIDITEVMLGFYMPSELSEVLQPIYIFKGKDFTAYVQAVPNSSIGE